MSNKELINGKYSIEKVTAEEELDFIDDNLVAFNLSQVPVGPDKDFISVNRLIRGEDGKIIAGCLAGNTPWDVGYIDEMWVDENFRRQGLGSALMLEVERVLRENGCYLILLDTFDWQARGFYEKLGYTVCATLEDCPVGHRRFYMQKRI